MKRLSVVMMVIIVLSALLTGCGSAGGAAGDPTDVAKEAMQAVADKKFDKLAELTCAAKKASIEDLFNPAGSLASAGVDAQKVMDAMTISFQDAQFTKVSEAADKAVVEMKAKMNVKVDKEKFKVVVMDMAKAQGQELPANQIDAILNMAAGQLEQTQDIDHQYDMIKENGKWVLCPSN